MKPLFILFIYLISGISFGQLGEDTLDINNSSAIISNYGTFFQDIPAGLPGYEIPKGSGLTSIYGLQFWFAGKDDSGNIHTALGGGPSIGYDYFNGPYSTTAQYSEPEYSAPFIFTICQEDIDNYIVWWNCLKFPDPSCDSVTAPTNEVLNAIYSWPAHGNLVIGQNYYLAPFFDNDNNGNYDPSAGDYPIIKGCCATYVIQNDDAGVHNFSNTNPIGIETHYMFYQYVTADFLNQVTFVDVLAINYGSTTYPEFVHGVMMDADLGYRYDDYFGSDSITSTMFIYNGDNNDNLAYGVNPPAIGITALDKAATSCMVYPGFSSPAESWNLLNGNLPSGGNLLDPTGQQTSFQYNGLPSDPSQWNETSLGSTIGDRKGIMSTIHGTFAPSDEIRQSYAILFAWNGDNLQNADDIISQAVLAKYHYDSTAYSSCETATLSITEEASKPEVSLYPNPGSNEVFIAVEGNIDLQVKVFNLAGDRIDLPVSRNGAELVLDTRLLESGVYLVRITGNNSQVTRRISIMN